VSSRSFGQLASCVVEIVPQRVDDRSRLRAPALRLQLFTLELEMDQRPDSRAARYGGHNDADYLYFDRHDISS
jgi:hypothetical protein